MLARVCVCVCVFVHVATKLISISYEFFRRFFKYRQDCNEDINDVFAHIFSDKHRTPLKHVTLRNCTITDHGMAALLQHDLVSLSLWYCDSITTASWKRLIEHGSNLRFLELGKYVDMLKYGEPNEKAPFDFQLTLPRLQKLILTAVVLQPTVQFSHLNELSYLDLTSCIFAEFSLEALVDLPNLTSLILFDVWPLESEVPTICKLKRLRQLDISTAHVNVSNGTYKNPNEVSMVNNRLFTIQFLIFRSMIWQTLAEIVEKLPLLTHLDISGTNLAGTGVAQFKAQEQFRSSDIPGLVGRANNPLQFLGLYNTAHSACRRHDIPAIHVRDKPLKSGSKQFLSKMTISFGFWTDFWWCKRRANFNIGRGLQRSSSSVDQSLEWFISPATFRDLQIHSSSFWCCSLSNG